MAKQCGYSNDAMQYAIDNKYDLVLLVSYSQDRSAFLIRVPQKEETNATE